MRCRPFPRALVAPGRLLLEVDRVGRHARPSIPDPQIVCIWAGSFQYQTSGQRTVNLAPSDFLFIEPNANHRLWIAPSEAKGEIAGMHLEFSPAGRWAAGDYRLAMAHRQVTHVEDTAYLQERFKRLASVYESYQPFRETLVNTIGQKIQRATTVEDTLQTAIREVGQALGAARVSAHIQAARHDNITGEN